MPVSLDLRKKPASVNVHVSSGTGVDITWADSHASHYDFAYLREQCPCATCNDERFKKEDMERRSGANPASASLPMFKPKPRARAAQAVGNYALQIEFTDGHSTGIYSFEYLRSICPCETCTRQRNP